MLGEMPPERLAGIVSMTGSANSHIAILARAMGVPTVMGAADVPWSLLQGREVIVDGFSGDVLPESVAHAARALRRHPQRGGGVLRGPRDS